MNFVTGSGFSFGEQFFNYLKDAFDTLYVYTVHHSVSAPHVVVAFVCLFTCVAVVVVVVVLPCFSFGAPAGQVC